jgi:hypothetical protein
MGRRFLFAALMSACAALVACGDASDAGDEDDEVAGTSEELLSGNDGLDYDVEDATDLVTTTPPPGAFTPRPPSSDDDDDGAEESELPPGNAPVVNRTIGKAPGGPPMTLHGGTVMPTATVYFIYYGDWSKNQRTQALHGSFVRGLAANAWNRDWLGASRFYVDGANDVAGTRIAVGKSIAVGAPSGKALTTEAIGTVVYDALAQKKLPIDPTGLYFVMTSQEVSQELERKDCGWHTEGSMTFTTQPLNIHYAWVADSRRQRCSIYPKGARTPNADYLADSQASVIAHELAESITDPNLDGFYEGDHKEIADKCGWFFEHVVTMKGGALANIHDRQSGRNWLVQDLFKNHACTLGAPK